MSAAAFSARTSAMVSATGFSKMTCLPASKQAMVGATWFSLVVVTATASTSVSAKIASSVSYAVPPWRSVNARALSAVRLKPPR